MVDAKRSNDITLVGHVQEVSARSSKNYWTGLHTENAINWRIRLADAVLVERFMHGLVSS